ITFINLIRRRYLNTHMQSCELDWTEQKAGIFHQAVLGPADDFSAIVNASRHQQLPAVRGWDECIQIFEALSFAPNKCLLRFRTGTKGANDHATLIDCARIGER